MKNSIKFSILLLILTPSVLFAAAGPEAFEIPAKLTAHSALRILTGNVRRAGKDAPEHQWSVRGEVFRALIQKINPDIFGLQEPIATQLQEIKEGLLKSGAKIEVFGESRGSSWLGMGADEYNPIFYNTDKLTLSETEQGTFKINDVKNSWLGIWTFMERDKTGMLPRICTWGRFKIKATGQEFYFYNTHFDNEYEEARLVCARNIAQHIAEQNQEGLPVLLVGDFNCDFKDAIREVLRGFVNTKEVAQHTMGPRETSTGWKGDKLKLIDHIVMREGDLSVINHMVVPHEGDIYPSDHRPVCADVIINDAFIHGMMPVDFSDIGSDIPHVA